VVLTGTGFEVMETGTACPYDTSPQGLICGRRNWLARQYSPAPERRRAGSKVKAIHLGSGHGQGRSPPGHHCLRCRTPAGARSFGI